MSHNNALKFMMLSRFLNPISNKSLSSSVHNKSSAIDSKSSITHSNTTTSHKMIPSSTPHIRTQTQDHSPKIDQKDKKEEQPHKVSRLGKAINQTKRTTAIYKSGSSRWKKRNKDKRKKKRGLVNKNELKCSSFKIIILMESQEQAPQFERYIIIILLRTTQTQRAKRDKTCSSSS